MKEKFRIELLGGFRLSVHDEVITSLQSSKIQQLLAYLILNRYTQLSRRSIAFIFWPDSTEKQALANLRNLLHQIRKVLPQAVGFIQLTNKTLKWNISSSCEIDLVTFEELTGKVDEAKIRDDSNRKLHLLTQAINLYKGDLLPDCYDPWIDIHRDRLIRKYHKALHEAILMLEVQRDYTTALQYNRMWTLSEPDNENAWHQLIQLYAHNNDIPGVMKSFNQYSEIISNEFNLKPSPKIRKLYNQIIESTQVEADPTPLKTNLLSGEWPMVGRKKEWETILECWKNAMGKKKCCLIIKGDPGHGKTRLGLEILNYAHNQGYGVAHSGCYEFSRHLSYTPIISWHQQEFIQKQLLRLDPVWITELTRLIPDLQRVQPEIKKITTDEDLLQRRQLLEAITLAVTTGDIGRLLFIDDLHWCDEKTLDWINYLFHSDHPAKLLLICTVRATESDCNPYMQRVLDDLIRDDYLHEITIGEINEAETLELAAYVAGNKLPQEIGQWLYCESEGHPLFVVEAVREGRWKELLNSEDGPKMVGDAPVLPKKVNQLISARLRQLSEPARHLTGVAATIGREFNLEILQLAGELEEPTFIKALEELINRHIIRELHIKRYDFTHGKLRDVAYNELSNIRRQWLHRQVAQAIQKAHSSNISEFNNQLHFHYERAGSPDDPEVDHTGMT